MIGRAGSGVGCRNARRRCDRRGGGRARRHGVHRSDEPFGTLVLALAVTVIEVALIVSVMVAGKAGSERSRL
jgi:hypothetical protein